jgi:hypothetical protein
MSSFQPTYIPAHLEGKVEDFRYEPGGGVSFRHDDAAVGNFGPEANRKMLSDKQFKQTFDRDYRLNNLNEAVHEQYGMPQIPASPSTQFTQWLGDKIRGGWDWGTSSQGKSVGTAALLSALAGGAAGLKMGQEDENPVSRGLLYALIAGGLGAGATAAMQHSHNAQQAALHKQASFDDQIVNAIMSDPSLSQNEKLACLRALSAASSQDKSQLGSLLSSVGGGALGVLIMKFLGAKGLLPLAAGGIIGSLLAGGSAGHKFNAIGQLAL